MSDSKKTNEINDKELKQVAGGGGYLFRCPVCNTEMRKDEHKEENHERKL